MKRVAYFRIVMYGREYETTELLDEAGHEAQDG